MIATHLLLGILINAQFFVTSFTGGFRKYNVSLFKYPGQQLTLSFDLAILDFRDAIAIFCDHFDCNEPELWISNIESDFDMFIESNIREPANVILSEYKWLASGDNKVVNEFNVQKIAKQKWKSYFRSKTSIIFSMKDMRLLLGDVVRLTGNSIVTLFELSSTLFNSEKYDLAIMVCHPYLIQLLEQPWDDANANVMMSALNIMAESYRMIGQLDTAYLFYAKVS